jgi:hypothetical protein
MNNEGLQLNSQCVMKLRNRLIKRIFVTGIIILIIVSIYILVADTLRPKSAPRQEFADIPPFPQSELTNSNVIMDKTVKVAEKRFAVTYESVNKASEISTWFRIELPRYGWTLTVPPADNDMPIQELYFEKNTSRLNISLVEVKEKNITEISIVVRPGLVREDLQN